MCSAQRTGGDGFAAFGGAAFTSLRADSVTRGTESAPGYAVGIGWRVGERLAFIFHGSAGTFRRGDVDAFELAVFGGGVRLHFPRSASQFVPYVDATADWNIARRDSAIGTSIGGRKELTGSTFSLGAGAMYRFTRAVALDVEVQGGTGDFKLSSSGYSGTTSHKYGASRFGALLGLAWYPPMQP